MPVPKNVRFLILRRDSFTCLYCGQRAPDVQLHVDHVHPASKGGEDETWNLVTACQACNAGKSDLEMHDLPDRVLGTLIQDLGNNVGLVWFGRMAGAPRGALKGFVMGSPDHYSPLWHYHHYKHCGLDDFDAAARRTRDFVEQSTDAGPAEAWDYFLEMCMRRAKLKWCNREPGVVK